MCGTTGNRLNRRYDHARVIGRQLSRVLGAAPDRSVLVLLFVVAIYRVSLLGVGANGMTDETRYFRTVIAVQAAREGDFRTAFAQIAASNGRQGAALAEVPLVLLQAIPAAFGVAASNPRSLVIPTAFNVIVSLVTLYLFVRIAHLLTADMTAALTAALLYALLVNSTFYVRHLITYDWSMCVGVYALWRCLSRPATLRLAAETGVLAGLMFTFYAGHYLFGVVLGLCVLGLTSDHSVRGMLRSGAVLTTGVIGVIAATELLCRAGGISYVRSSLDFSRTVRLGSYDEGWTYLAQYLWQVERASGVVLIIATLVALGFSIDRARRWAPTPFDYVLLSATLIWAWQAFNSAQLHNMVVYGRLIKPWFFVMALALAHTLAMLRGRTEKRMACVTVVICAIWSWVPSALELYRLAYPADVLYAFHVDSARIPVSQSRCDLATTTTTFSPGPLDRETRYPYDDDSNYVLINFCHGPPRPDPPPPIEETGELLFDGPHFLTSPAYAFEGFSPDERDRMTRHAYRVRLYRRER